MAETLQQHWNRRYEATAPEALTWHQDHNEVSLALIAKYGPAGDASAAASVIDIGAGNAGLADDLLARGCRDLTLLDLSAAALSQTKRRLAEKGVHPTFVEADITRWSPPRQWDIWHDRAVFHFLTGPGEQDAYLAALRKGTAAGALILMATFSLAGPEKCSGLAVQRYSPDSLSARLGNGFARLEGFQKDHATPAGGRQNFTHAAFRRL